MSTIKANAIVDAAGGNTTTINGAIPASLASPTFTGTPLAPTATVGTNTTQLATTAFVLANGGATVNIQVFTATGTYTPTAGYKWGIAFVTGGGGGQRGIGTTDSARPGAGAGGTAIGLLNLSTLGAVTATVGAGGTGGTSSGATGANGAAAGNSTLSTLTGFAGSSVNDTSQTGFAGGAASGVSINITGGTGTGADFSGDGSVFIGGMGGASFWGGGGRRAGGETSGGAGAAFGSGAGGAASTSTEAGLAGAAGVIMILEFK